MSERSPFLHRERAPAYVYYEDAERRRQEDYKAQARLTLEALRYKRLYAGAVDLQWRVVQRLGDSYRAHGWLYWLAVGGYLLFVGRYGWSLR